MKLYIEDLPDGRVRYRMPYKCPLTGKTKRVSAIYEKDNIRNRRRAEEYLQEQIEQILMQSSNDVTLEHALCLYLKDKAKHVKESTLVRDTASLNRLCTLFPKDTMIRNITTLMWKNVLETKSEGKPGTFNEYLKRLKIFLKWCYMNDIIESSAIYDKLQRMHDASPREKITDKYLEQAEIKPLIDAMEGMDQWQLLTKFLILSGLRIGEAVALERDDINGGYIHVNKTYNIIVKKVTSPKTLDSIRDVSMQKELEQVVREVIKYNNLMAIRYNCHSRLLFPHFSDSQHINAYSYTKCLKEVSMKVLGRSITPHVLRHTSASLLLAADVPIDMISRRLGHSDSRITKEIYLHIMEERKQKDADRIADIKMLG